MKPFKLKPVFKDYLWGGKKLKNMYASYDTPTPFAEAWLLSANKDGPSIIDGSENISFFDYINDNKSDVGENAKNLEFFPILSKLIDAKDNLSVQVHPDDNYALKHENSFGKNEIWYIVNHDEDAFIYFGFKKDITKEKFLLAIKNQNLESLLNKIFVEKGDFFYIPSGTIHAIGKGCVIAEIQQNSNITYRLYDYARIDKDGKKRELHLEKGIDVLNFEKTKADSTEKREILSDDGKHFFVKTPDFMVQEINSSLCKLNVEDSSFHSIIVLNGVGKLTYNGEIMDIKEGDSIFLPASLGDYTLAGNFKILLTTV